MFTRKTGSLRRRCDELICALGLPEPIEVSSLIAHVSQIRSRPIVLHPMPGLSEPGAPCGVWLATDYTDHIFYETVTSTYHQTQIVLHDMGHVISNDPPREGEYEYLTRRLLPNLDPAMVKRVLMRGGFNHPEEDRAEMIASLILERSTAWDPTMPVSETPLLDALSQALGRRR